MNINTFSYSYPQALSILNTIAKVGENQNNGEIVWITKDLTLHVPSFFELIIWKILNFFGFIYLKSLFYNIDNSQTKERLSSLKTIIVNANNPEGTAAFNKAIGVYNLYVSKKRKIDPIKVFKNNDTIVFIHRSVNENSPNNSSLEKEEDYRDAINKICETFFSTLLYERITEAEQTKITSFLIAVVDIINTRQKLILENTKTLNDILGNLESIFNNDKENPSVENRVKLIQSTTFIEQVKIGDVPFFYNNFSASIVDTILSTETCENENQQSLDPQKFQDAVILRLKSIFDFREEIIKNIDKRLVENFKNDKSSDEDKFFLSLLDRDGKMENNQTTISDYYEKLNKLVDYNF